MISIQSGGLYSDDAYYEVFGYGVQVGGPPKLVAFFFGFLKGSDSEIEFMRWAVSRCFPIPYLSLLVVYSVSPGLINSW